MSRLRIAFDVDGTLIYDGNPKFKVNGDPMCDTPRYDVIDLFFMFENLGCELFIWSGGGVEYAERWRNKLGLSAQVVEKGSFLPDIAVDDMDVTLGKVNIKV